MAVDNRFSKLEALSKNVKEKRNKSKDVTKSEAFTNLRLIANKAKNERAVENARRSEPESDRDINIGIRQFGNKNSNTGISKTKYIKNLEGASNLDELIKSKEKTSPQSLRSVTPEEIVSTRVEKDPRPSLLDALVNSQKGQSHISGAKVIQSALKDYGGDPDEIYDTSKTSADRRLAYEMAARNDPDNPLTKAENTKINIDMPKKQVQDEILSYTMMTDEEKRRYNEIYGMYGKYQAEEYRGRLRDAINQRIAEEQVKSDREIQNPFGRTVYMFGQGMASGVSGVGESAEWLSGMDRKKPTSVGEYTASGIRNDEDNSVAENVIYDIAQSTGYMAPGVITSGALGALGVSTKAAQTGGNVLFGLAQSGNTYRQDINEGQDPDKAWLHGLQQGVDETATNWLLGGVNAFGGGALKRVIANSGAGRAFTSGIDKIAKSQTGRVLLRRAADSLADMGSEAAQEYLQFYTENLTRNLLYGEDNSLDPLDPDAWYSAALGALNAGILNMPQNIIKTTRGISADVSMAKDTSEALDLDRSHYRSSEDYKKVETLKKVADEVASKAAAGTISIKDKVAYSEALADVLTSEANTGYNTESINNTDQVNVRMLEVSTGSETEIKRTMDEATEQWRKILTNPEMTAAVSTDGTSAYDIERQGEDLIFTHSVGGEIRERQAYKIADIGKGGDADILNVVPLQSSDPAVPKLNTFVDYAKSSGLKETAAANESGTPVQESSVISGQNNSQADVSAPAAVRQDTAVRPVSAEDRSEFGSYANVYSAALGSKRSTDNMINLWDGKNRDRYLTAYKRIYTAGLNDIDVDTMLRDPMNIYLTDRQREQAYKDGMLDANERKRNRKEFAKGEAREGGITKGSEQASTEQRDFLNWIGDKTGLKIEVREGLKGNAEINLEKGVMRINPYSKDFIGSVSHELTHMIKAYAPQEYDTLQRLTVSALMRSRNVSYDELYKTYEEKYRTEVNPDYTVEDILEEITADGATAYMNDQEFADRIAREDRSLAKKIADFFKGIADTLKKLINEKGIRNVGRVMRENEAQYRIAANTWYNALEKAAARYKEGYTVNAPEMDWERYALRLNEEEITKDYIEHNYEIVTNMPPVAKLTGREFDITEGKGSDAVVKYFDSLGNSAENSDAGIIDLTKRFVKDVLGHKPNRRKFIMMAAVPDIISEGRIIDYRKDYDEQNSDRITIAAPITISKNSGFGGDYYGVVSIKVTPKNNRAYILNYAYTKREDDPVIRQTRVGIIDSQRPGTGYPLDIGSILEKLQNYNARQDGNEDARLEIERKAEDLRFQLNVDEDPEPVYRDDIIISSNRDLKDAADTLGTLLSAIDYMPSDQAIERTAKRLKKYTATDTSVEDISSGLKSMFNYIAYNNNINGEEISSIAADYAGELITNSTKTAYDPVAEAEYRRYRDAIKSYTFHLPAGFEGELEALGGVARLRREFFGTLNITKSKGVSIDTMYQELAELHPDLFDRDRANPADQLEDIVDHLRMLKPSPKVNYFNENDYDAYRYYAGQEIFKAYIAEGAAEAGRRSEYQNLKREYNRKLKENAASETEMSMLQEKATEMQTKYLDQLEKSKKMVTKQTMRQRVSEARQSTKMRYYKDQIIKDTKELSRWLLKPTDAKHVPESLRKPLAEFLQYVDFSSKDLNPQGEPTQRSELWTNLKDAWAAVANNGGIAEDGPNTQYIEFDPDLVSKMQDLTDKIKNMDRMEDLDYIGVLQLSDIVKSMKHAITSANEMISTEKYKTVARAAESTLSELGTLKTKPEYAGVRGFIQNIAGNRMLDAGTRFHTFGDAAEDIYKGLRNGFNQKVFRTAEAEHKFKEMLKKAGATSHDINKWSGQLAEPVSITTERGEKLTLTTAQVMSLYELMKRPQARDHILTGGITSARLRWHGRYMKTGNVKVTRADVVNLIGQLSEKQKEVADGIAAIFQDTAQWGNNASMKLYGYKKFNDPHYFPIRVDRNYLTTTSDQAALNTNAVSIKNMGMTKSTVPHANNPLVLDDIFQVFTEQVNNMSNYEAFVVPLSDLQKWYNFKDSDLDEKYKTSIKRELERTFGTGANQFINKFMEDINGLTNTERYFLKELISAFKGSAVGANLSVAIQQPTSYARALAVMDSKYLLKAFTAKAEIGKWENIKKYSAIAAWKDWGFYEIDTGRTMRNILTDPDTPLDKAREWQMLLAAKGDQITWKRIWVAAELQVKDRHPELEAGSEAFFKEVARVFDDVIDRTQVVDSVFHRTDLMRSKNDLTQMSTSYMSEPMKSYSMIYRAVFDYTNAKTPEAKRIAAGMFGKSITAFLLSNALAGMAKAIVLAMRDQGDERDKDFWERWKGYAISESAGNVMPWNYFPFVRDVVSIFEGYNVQRTDMNAVQDLYYVFNRWKKYFKGESQYTLPNNILYTTKALSTATGLALYGLQRDVNAVIDTAIEAFGADEAAYEKDKVVSRSIKQKSNLGYYVKRAMRAYQSGNTALGDKIVSDLIDAGIAEDDINSKFKEYTKKAMVEDPEGAETLNAAFDQIASGSGSAAIDKYKKQLISEGYDSDNIDIIIKSQADEYLEGNGINYKGLNDTLNEITSFSTRNFDTFYSAYKKWANVSEFKNGWDAAECRKNFRTQCTKYFKPLYKAGNATERSRILNILSRIKIDGSPLYEEEADIIDWGKEDE